MSSLISHREDLANLSSSFLAQNAPLPKALGKLYSAQYKTYLAKAEQELTANRFDALTETKRELYYLHFDGVKQLADFLTKDTHIALRISAFDRSTLCMCCMDRMRPLKAPSLASNFCSHIRGRVSYDRFRDCLRLIFTFKRHPPPYYKTLCDLRLRLIQQIDLDIPPSCKTAPLDKVTLKDFETSCLNNLPHYFPDFQIHYVAKLMRARFYAYHDFERALAYHQNGMFSFAKRAAKGKSIPSEMTAFDLIPFMQGIITYCVDDAPHLNRAVLLAQTELLDTFQEAAIPKVAILKKLRAAGILS